MYDISILELVEVEKEWNYILWGIENKIVNMDSFIKYVQIYIASSSNLDIPELIELAWGRHSIDETVELLKIASKSRVSSLSLDYNGYEARVWLYSILSYEMGKLKSISKFLDRVEEIYADFDYPIEIEGFVRYMPPVESEYIKNNSKEESEEKMYEYSKKFLENEKENLRKIIGRL
ncbi:MAG: DUF2247 family protein [Clostridia bacterium]|jgi:hypothetical protein|nr:DUF2247 family protein [Clostridia bacterium]